MASTTVSSVLNASIPKCMTHSDAESMPRAWGVESELRKLGLQKGYSAEQEAGIIRAANDYLRFARENQLSWWSKNVLDREEDNAKEMSESEAATEKVVLQQRRMEMVAALKELILGAEQ